MMDESDGDFARGIELPNLDASRLFGVDVPHARGSDTGANAAEESRRIAAFDHAVQDCAGAFAGLVEQSAPLLGGDGQIIGSLSSDLKVTVAGRLVPMGEASTMPRGRVAVKVRPHGVFATLL